MSSDELADFWVHEVSVRTYLGTTGEGVKQYADAVTVPCFLSRKRRYVRAPNGDQVISESALSADAAQSPVLAPQSEVTIPDDPPTVTTVITRADSSGGTFIEGIDRVKAYLQ